VLTWKETKALLESKSNERLGKSAIKILEMIFQTPGITIPELAAKIKTTERAIEKNFLLKSY
jgi:hypothetical protein